MPGAPSEYPEWALDGTNNDEPLSGQKDTGWENNQIAVSSYFNWWQNLQYKWTQFLDKRHMAPGLKYAIPDPVVSTGESEFPGNNTDYLGEEYMYALVPSPGHCYLKQGSGNNKLAIAGGLMLQLIGSELLGYEFTGTEEVTIANGDATHPRVDIVQAVIECDADGVPMVTLSVKQGTPAASPAYPVQDDGKCVVAGVVVGQNYAAGAGFVFGVDTAGAVAVVHDQRMPMGVRFAETMPINMIANAADWTLSAGNTLLTQTANGGNALHIPCLDGGRVARLLDVVVGFLDKAAYASKISRLRWVDAGDSTNVTVSASVDLAAGNGNLNSPGGSQYSRRRMGQFVFQGTLAAFAAGPDVLPNANGMGAPIWTNGSRCPTYAALALGDSTDKLCVKYPTIATTGSKFGPAGFWIAGGL